MTWPFICIYNNYENFLWVSSINDNSGKQVNLFKMPKETIDIKQTQITTSHELFILCRSAQWTSLGVEITNRLYSIDLDAIKKMVAVTTSTPVCPLELVF